MSAIVLKRTGQKTVFEAIKAGYRLLDGAGDYGNEKEAGDGVRRAIEAGILWNTFHARDHVKSITKKQLGLWGIDYFDLFLIHFPISLQYVDPDHRYPPEWFDDHGRVQLQNTPMQETWGGMEELVDQGLTKNIGLSNCSGSIILDVLRYARIEPQVLQVEMHPYLVQAALVDLARTLGIAVTAYSSLGPQGYVELSMDKGAASLLSLDAIKQIASKHDKSPAQVLLRWATQRGIAVVPKSNTVERIAENLRCTSFDLEPEEIKEISALNMNLRINCVQRVAFMAEEIDYEALPANAGFAVNMLAGALAGISEHAVMFPVDSIKTRMQVFATSPVAVYSGVGNAFTRISSTEGMRALWRGVSSVVLGAGPAHAVHFGTLEAVKELAGGNEAGNQWLATSLAGASATIASDALMNPFDGALIPSELLLHTKMLVHFQWSSNGCRFTSLNSALLRAAKTIYESVTSVLPIDTHSLGCRRWGCRGSGDNPVGRGQDNLADAWDLCGLGHPELQRYGRRIPRDLEKGRFEGLWSGTDTTRLDDHA
ncbi:hypothetical protein C0991_005436 [Blastosporella zonata]|nr:hypothetical protein C0991_005436 [Blastosporella zonata]